MTAPDLVPILGKYPVGRRDALMALLQDVQEACGDVPVAHAREAETRAAGKLDVDERFLDAKADAGIEVMTCPGGCINGGGQPRHASPEAVRARVQRRTPVM